MDITIHIHDNEKLTVNARFIWPLNETGGDEYRENRMRVTLGGFDLSLSMPQAIALADTILDAAHARRAEIAALNDRVSRPQGSEVLDASNG
jgi:hypothetical protein